jgi:hypothetical protein
MRASYGTHSAAVGLSRWTSREHLAPAAADARNREQAEAGAVEDVLDIAVGIDDEGRLIPAASIGQRQ